MPFKKRIADVEQTIDETVAQISKLRNEEPKATAKVEQLLIFLARLKAERLRLMRHQRLISK